MQFGYEKGFLVEHFKGTQNVNGIFVAIVWLIEAGAIMGIPVFTCLRKHGCLAYCEPCGRWTSDAAVVRKVEPTQALSIVEGLQQGNVARLAECAVGRSYVERFSPRQAAVCEGCAASNYLTLERIRITIDAKKNKSEKATTLIDKLAVSADDGGAVVCDELVRQDLCSRA